MMIMFNQAYHIILEQMLSPDDAVDGLGGRVADGAAGKGLGRRLGQAVVALAERLAYERYLADVAGAAALDEWPIGGQAQPIDVAARRLVVQRVQHQIELLEVLDVVLDALVFCSLLFVVVI